MALTLPRRVLGALTAGLAHSLTCIYKEACDRQQICVRKHACCTGMHSGSRVQVLLHWDDDVQWRIIARVCLRMHVMS